MVCTCGSPVTSADPPPQRIYSPELREAHLDMWRAYSEHASAQSSWDHWLRERSPRRSRMMAARTSLLEAHDRVHRIEERLFMKVHVYPPIVP